MHLLRRTRCSHCEALFRSEIRHAGGRVRKYLWKCNHKYEADVPCETPHLSDAQITEAFMDAVHMLLTGSTGAGKIVGEAVLAELDTAERYFETG